MAIVIPIVYCLHAILQEIIARGTLQRSFKQFLIYKPNNRLNMPIFLSSLIFACAHAFNGVQVVIGVFLPGLFWGWLYERQGNIFGVGISHAIIGVCFIEYIGPI